MFGSKLVEVIHSITDDKVNSHIIPGFVIGNVISLSPLRIKVSDNIILESSMLILHSLVKETWINVPTHEESGHDHNCIQPNDSMGNTEATFDTQKSLTQIKLWRGLKTGDVVRMLRLQGGQMYYVLEREEGVLNDVEEGD